MVVLLVFLFDTHDSAELNEGRNKLATAAKVDFEKNVNDTVEKIRFNVSVNEVIMTSSSPVTVRPMELVKQPISNDVTGKLTTSSADNDYQSMKRAFDTFNEKMEIYMNFYGNEMSFLTTKLNTIKDKLNTLEILQHEIDQVLNRQNAADQKLQLIQDSLFGSQSITGKLDRIEFSVHQLHNRIDELMEKQRKFTPQTIPVKRKKESDDPLSDNDEQFRSCESKIEQLVAFVHSFAELNRLESTDILNRLGNMQSQLIQFFDVKGTIIANQFSQQSDNSTIEQGFDIVDESTQYLNRSNETNVLKDVNATDVIVNDSSEIPSTLSNLNDDKKLFTSNSKSNRKRKRTTNMVS